MPTNEFLGAGFNCLVLGLNYRIDTLNGQFGEGARCIRKADNAPGQADIIAVGLPAGGAGDCDSGKQDNNERRSFAPRIASLEKKHCAIVSIVSDAQHS
jgi:hypothetical protein